jgi:branched-chain amino acid transport system substrate-binding protein
MQHPRITPMLYATVVVLIAACRASTPAPAAPTVPPPATSAAAPTEIYPAPSAAPTAAAAAPSQAGALPAAGSASAAAGGRIVIGVQSPASGPQAALGIGIRNGATMAVLQLARPLTDLGYSLELRPLDDQGEQTTAEANAELLVADGDTRCAVGNLGTPTTRAALRVYGAAQLALVAPASAGVGITGDSDAGSLRLIGRDDVQAAIGARFARESLKAASAFLVAERSDYGEVLASAFKGRCSIPKG